VTAISTNISRSTMTQYAAAICTGVVGEPFSSHLVDKFKEGWRKIVDDHLIYWGLSAKNGSSTDDEFAGPTLASLQSFVAFIDDGSHPVASRVTPNGEGGVCAEWQSGDFLIKMEFTEDGSVRFIAFHGTAMVGHSGY
jgi:hypothetical protein